MMKKVLSIAALWLALIALVFVYTDSDEYTWRFSDEMLSRVLITEEEAQKIEADAQAAMDVEQAEAFLRSENGEWGNEDMYAGAPKTRSAVDEALGLNLMWGRYDVVISYVSPQPFSIRAVSALRQSFIENGQENLSEGEHDVMFTMNITDSCQQLAFACDLPEGAEIESIMVKKAESGIFDRDLAAYAALLGGVLTVLLVLAWDEGSDGKARRRDTLCVILIALFASMPLLFGGVYEGHDLFFHLNRIEGIAAGLREGQFPVRIHSSTLLGYGYAAPQFYPEFFLYLPAVMRNLGVSLAACVRVFEMLINLAAASVCYISARKLFDSRRIALGASALYTLCNYRIANLYIRTTLGESLAMIFFPLLIWATYEVLVRDEKKWPLMTLAMTGIFLSHLLSTLFAAGLCAAAALLCAKRLIREPRRILACVKAAALTALCSAVFLVPFLDSIGGLISTSVAITASEHVLRLGAYFVGFPGQTNDLPYEALDFAYTVGVVPGLAMMLGCAILLVRLYAHGEEMQTAQDRLCRVLLAFGALLLLGATEIFPWAWACNLPTPYSTFFMQIQYPWRLVGVAAPMLSLAAAWGFMREEKHRTAGLCAVIMLCAVFAGYSMQVIVQDVPMLKKESFCDTRIEQYEYTFPGTEKGALEPGNVIAYQAPEYAVRNYEKRGTKMSFALDVPKGLSMLELPLLYYPGYRVTDNGNECRTMLGTNNVIRVLSIQEGMDRQIEVYFDEPAAWTAAVYVSAVGFALLGVLMLCGRKRRA